MHFVDKVSEMKRKGARLVTVSSDGKKVYYHFSLRGKIITRQFPASKVRSICRIFPNAELYERELMEKKNIKFKGHPNPTKLFT